MPETGGGRTLCFDVETDGLLAEASIIHCIWACDVDTGEYFEFSNQPGMASIDEGVAFVEAAERVIAHNGIDFDLLVVKKLHPEFVAPPIWDTLVITKLLWPSDVLWGHDQALVAKGRLPANLAKRYSLESWGYRTGVMKDLYSGGWEVWNPEMHAYCKQDVAANVKLWKLCKRKLGWDPERPPEDGFVYPVECVEREQRQHALCLEMHKTGCGFDVEHATSLAADLAKTRAEIDKELCEVFGSWWEPVDDPKTGTEIAHTRSVSMAGHPDVTIRRFSEKTGKELKPYVGPPKVHYEKGSVYCRIERVEFNPGSRQHIGKRLMELFGWKPAAFGLDGSPTLDEGTLKAIPDGVLPAGLKGRLLDRFVVSKTLGAVAEGKKSWLAMVGKMGRKQLNDGRMHGRVDPLGAVTGRGIHSEPNLSQTPSVVVDKDTKKPVLGLAGGYGWECRQCFTPRKGWAMYGSDISSLELGLMGHYLAKYDGGEFARRMADPALDPHEENSKLTGLSRADTKTVTYASIYGAGPLLIGEACGYTQEEEAELLKSKRMQSYFNFMRSKLGGAFKEPTKRERALVAKGQIVIGKFEAGIVGYKDLKEELKEQVSETGYLRSIGGRKIWVNKGHVAFNYLLQGGGAEVCKAWAHSMEDILLRDHGLKHGRDYNRMIWAHDEYQMEGIHGAFDAFKAASLAGVQQVCRDFGYVGLLRTETKMGASWAETH